MSDSIHKILIGQLDKSILDHNKRARILPDTRFALEYQFHSRPFPGKSDKMFWKMKKTLFLGYFGHFFPKYDKFLDITMT